MLVMVPFLVALTHSLLIKSPVGSSSFRPFGAVSVTAKDIVAVLFEPNLMPLCWRENKRSFIRDRDTRYDTEALSHGSSFRNRQRYIVHET